MGFLPAKKLSREQLRHDHRFLGTGQVVRVEIASGQDRRAHRLEVTGADAVEVYVLVRLHAVDEDAIVPAAAADRDDERLRGRHHAWQRRHAPRDVVIQRRPSWLWHAGVPEIEVGDDKAFLLEPGIQRHQVAEAADEQQGADDQHERQRDLTDDQRAAHAETLAGVGGSAAAGLHRGAGCDAGGAQRGHQAEQQTGRGGEGRGKGEHPPVEGERDEDSVVLAGEKLHEKAAE